MAPNKMETRSPGGRLPSSSANESSSTSRLPKATGFLRRPKNKNTSPAIPSPELGTSSTNGVSQLGGLDGTEAQLWGWALATDPVGDDRVDSGYGLSRSETQSSSTSHESSIPPTIDIPRRGSAISTQSSLSHSPNSPIRPNGLPPHRNSRSSFASSSGSPLTTASNFSGGTTIGTIGDLSTASMPLLPGGGRGSETGHSVSGWTRPSSRYQADSSSAASFSDASSVHSYPPRPRTYTSSTRGSSEGGLDGWRSWSRDLDATSNTGSDRRRANSSTGYSTYGKSGSSYHQPNRTLPTVTAANQNQVISYALSSPSISRSPHTSPTASLNPLAPLRKRLARSIMSGKRGGVEVQLVLELIDALETCIQAGSSSAAAAVAAAAANNNASSGNAVASTSSSKIDDPLLSTTTAPSTSPPKFPSDAALLAEVRSLVRELCEIAPDAQRCLTEGLYGPLAFTKSSSSPGSSLRPSSSQGELRDTGTIDWWPRRLARDCRALLEEVGLSLNGNEAPRLRVVVGGGSSRKVGMGGLGAIGGVDAVGCAEVIGGNGAGGGVSAGGSNGGIGAVGGGAGEEEEEEETPLEEALRIAREDESGGVAGGGYKALVESKASVARREQLLIEGQRRWAEFRKRQADDYGEPRTSMEY